MGFNRRKMEDQSRQVAATEAAARRDSPFHSFSPLFSHRRRHAGLAQAHFGALDR
jgi:hypothetical protein